MLFNRSGKDKQRKIVNAMGNKNPLIWDIEYVRIVGIYFNNTVVTLAGITKPFCQPFVSRAADVIR